MKGDEVIKQTTETVLRELNLKCWQFDIKQIVAESSLVSRQIRLFDTAANDKAAVFNFQATKGNLSRELKQLKKRIKKQLMLLSE